MINVNLTSCIFTKRSVVKRCSSEIINVTLQGCRQKKIGISLLCALLCESDRSQDVYILYYWLATAACTVGLDFALIIAHKAPPVQHRTAAPIDRVLYLRSIEIFTGKRVRSLLY